MKITFFYRVKPKTSSYKPIFYTPENDKSSLEKKMDLHNDSTSTLRERLDSRWEEERKYKAISQ